MDVLFLANMSFVWGVEKKKISSALGVKTKLSVLSRLAWVMCLCALMEVPDMGMMVAAELICHKEIFKHTLTIDICGFHRHTQRRSRKKISTVSLSHVQTNSRSVGSHIPVLHSRSNLVSVPIQDSGTAALTQPSYFVAPPTTAAYNYTYTTQPSHVSYGTPSYYVATNPATSSYPNYQQPPPPVLPPPQLPYDSSSSSYSAQWNATGSISHNPPYYR